MVFAFVGDSTIKRYFPDFLGVFAVFFFVAVFAAVVFCAMCRFLLYKYGS